MANKGLNQRSPYHRNLSAMLPPDILEAIKEGKSTIPLDPDKVSVYYYKKDDWLVWANPMIYAILDDIIMLESNERVIYFLTTCGVKLLSSLKKNYWRYCF